MNEIEKQILLNQVDIMRNLSKMNTSLDLRLQETSNLLNPKGADEDCCDMEEVQGIIIRAVKGISHPNKEEAKVFDVWYNKQFAKRGRGE